MQPRRGRRKMLKAPCMEKERILNRHAYYREKGGIARGMRKGIPRTSSFSLSPEDSPRIRNRESPHAHEPRTNNRVLALEYIHARASARAQSHLPRCSFSILAYRLGREELLLNRESRALVTHPLLDIRALRNCERRRRRV